MQLDRRSGMILDLFCEKYKLTDDELLKKYDLSKRQLNYCIEKINDYLVYSDLPEIHATASGIYILDEYASKVIMKKRSTMKHKNYIFSEDERIQLVVLILLSRQEMITLWHFISDLKVSKNTILNDMKQLKSRIQNFGLQIQNIRDKGYFIEGTELSKRKLLIQIVDNILLIKNGKSIIKQCCELTEEEIEVFRLKLEELEKGLQTYYTDERILSISISSALVWRRICQGKYLEKDSIVHEELKDTREYQLAYRLLDENMTYPKEEIFFITLQLLSAPISKMEFISDEFVDQMTAAIHELIQRFEQNACLYLQGKEDLTGKILQHLKPMYYRVKYNLKLPEYVDKAVSQEMYMNEFRHMHNIVRKSIAPIETLFDFKLPEDELLSITILLASWTGRQKEEHKVKKGVIVCTSGISISEILYQLLTELFPEIEFLPAMSIREFYTLEEIEYDAVFSSTYVETSKHLFVIHPFMDNKEKMQLRQHVMRALYSISGAMVDISTIEDIIGQHANVINKRELRRDLKKYMMTDVDDSDLQSKSPELSKLLRFEHIQIKKEVKDWDEALNIAAWPLLNKGYIKESYLQEIVELFKKEENRILWGKDLIVPHADPQSGVYRTGMSLLKLEKGLLCQGEKKARIIVMLAPVNKKQHLKAILQLFALAENEKDMKKLCSAVDGREIYQVIRKYDGLEND